MTLHAVDFRIPQRVLPRSMRFLPSWAPRTRCHREQEPSESIRIIVPFVPSGAVGVMAHLMADRIGQAQSLALIVDNRPAAGTEIGAELLARALPDAKTLLRIEIAFVINQHLPKQDYDRLTRFEPTCNRARVPMPRSGWQRDPIGMRQRILAAATEEFARYGLSGARVDRIADAAGANKRMIYYHVGNKERLYLEVLEAAYEHIRAAERELKLEKLAPVDALLQLMEVNWHYYLQHPELMALLNTENLHRARYIKRSRKVKQLHSPFVAMIADILRRGEADGTIRKGIDAVQLYISIAGLSYLYVSNNHTLSTIFGKDLLSKPAKAARLRHMSDLLAAALRPGWPASLDQDTHRC